MDTLVILGEMSCHIRTQGRGFYCRNIGCNGLNIACHAGCLHLLVLPLLQDKTRRPAIIKEFNSFYCFSEFLATPDALAAIFLLQANSDFYESGIMPDNRKAVNIPPL